MLRNMFCLKSRWLLILFCLFIGFATLQAGAVQQVAAQTVNPTPIIISLTPQATATPALGHDGYEPNNDLSQASGVGAQTITGLTLPAGDVDYFALLLPAGHTVTAETWVQDGLDTQLTLWVNGQLVASNDNKGGSDAGSRVVYTATGDATIIILVEPLAGTSGRYDLQLSLLAPTATPQSPATVTQEPSPTPTQQILPTATQPPTTTPFPTATPIPTNTPLPPPPTATMIVWPTATSQPIWPTATPQPVWPTHTPTAQTLTAAPIVPMVTPLPANGGSAASSEPVALIPISPTVTTVSVTAVLTSSPEIAPTPTPTVSPTLTVSTTVPTTTVAISTTGVVTTAALTLEHIGRIPTPTPETATYIRLLIYYDANNDRAPGPTEGISNVSVLAVNDHGQQLAHLFTNRQGEAVFTLTSADASRLIVPFVPSWSARIQPSQHNDTVILGLPAVRLPVFLPVQPAAEPDRPR